MLSHGKHITLIILLGVVLILISFTSLFLGSEILAPSEVVDALLGRAEKNIDFIVNQVRLPRV